MSNQKKSMPNKAEKIPYRSGFAGLIGWTNVGKSTLINALTGMNVSITADCPQTTRYRILGIIQDDNYQIAMADTPGIHHSKRKVSQHMVQTAWDTIPSMDAIIWMVFPDKSAKFQISAFEDHLKSLDKPLIIVVNKIDTVSKSTLLPLINDLNLILSPHAVIPISATEEDNLDHLLDILVKVMPEAPPMYPEDVVTDQPQRILVSEMIREQVIQSTSKEIPHVIAVEVDQYKEKGRDFLEITATIFVERPSQKGIIIGKGGLMLKEIGTKARQNMEEFLGKKIYLDLWVKVLDKWREKPSQLRRFGITG